MYINIESIIIRKKKEKKFIEQLFILGNVILYGQQKEIVNTRISF